MAEISAAVSFCAISELDPVILPENPATDRPVDGEEMIRTIGATGNFMPRIGLRMRLRSPLFDDALRSR